VNDTAWIEGAPFEGVVVRHCRLEKQPANLRWRRAERLAARARGLEYEIPVYKYETLFKPLEDLLEKKPEPAPKARK